MQVDPEIDKTAPRCPANALDMNAEQNQASKQAANLRRSTKLCGNVPKLACGASAYIADTENA